MPDGSVICSASPAFACNLSVLLGWQCLPLSPLVVKSSEFGCCLRVKDMLVVDGVANNLRHPELGVFATTSDLGV